MQRIILTALLFSTISQGFTSNDPHAMAKKAFEYTNEFRHKKGLPTFQWHPQVAEIAHQHSHAMATNVVGFGHEGFAQRIGKLPFFVGAAAENVFKGNMAGDRARTAVDGWIQSPGHLKNLVGNYTWCSIGVCRDAQGYWYFTQIFCRS